MKRVADRRVKVTRAKSDKRFLATDSTTTADQQRKAALTACGWAASNGGVEVARELLEMLGLATRAVAETRRDATGVGTTDLESETAPAETRQRLDRGLTHDLIEQEGASR